MAGNPSMNTNGVDITIQRLAHGANLDLPAPATDLSAGADLLAAVTEALILPPGGRAIIPTGIAIGMPGGFEAQIRPRSGLAAKHGVTVLNAPGTIDADYRGEIGVILINHGDEPFTITRGQRIAQLIIAPVSRAQWIEVDTFDETPRGDGGFGSTGTGG
jgi:dUTP pyrophosphatase